jgi:acyl carrier protein phosphodiesterase
MNYLAHSFLSRPTPHSIVGNLMGDFRKHISPVHDLPGAVIRGIENHMQVDRFTDNDPRVIELKKLFSKRRRRFAGIIIDVTFDYFLLKHWNLYSKQEPQLFIQGVYKHLREQRYLMPEEMVRVTSLMAVNDWFSSYATLQGIGCVLDRMSARIRFENNLSGSVEEVLSHYQSLEKGFLDFFPRLNEHISRSRIES